MELTCFSSFKQLANMMDCISFLSNNYYLVILYLNYSLYLGIYLGQIFVIIHNLNYPIYLNYRFKNV